MKNLNLKLIVYEGLNSLERLRPAWEDLLASYPAASIFSTWEWLAPWWRAFGGGQQLLVFAFFDDDGKLAALAPLSIGTQRGPGGIKFRVLRLMGDGSQDSDNLDLPVRPGYEDAFIEALLNGLQQRAHAWHYAEMNTFPSSSPAAALLSQHLSWRRWTTLTHRRPWSVVSLPDTWDKFLKQLTSKERGKIGLRTRRLEKRCCVRFVKCTDQQGIPPCLEALFSMHQRHWQILGEPGSFLLEARRNFYFDIARTLLARQWLEFWFLDLDGKPVAAQFGFRYRNTVYSLQEGFDPDYSSDSVGYVLRGYVLKQLIAEGVSRYDFLAGEAPSKARWGAQVSNYIDLHFARPYTLGSAYLKLRHSAQQTKEWLRAHLHGTAWLALHRINVRLQGASPPKGAASEE